MLGITGKKKSPPKKSHHWQLAYILFTETQYYKGNIIEHTVRLLTHYTFHAPYTNINETIFKFLIAFALESMWQNHQDIRIAFCLQ